MQRKGSEEQLPRIDPLWKAWLTETCDPYAWRRLDAAIGRLAGTGSVLAELLSWQDTGIVPPPNLAWALGEALYDCGVTWSSGVLALWVAGHLGEVVCVMATCAGRWPKIIAAVPLALSTRPVFDATPDARKAPTEPFRDVVTLTPKEREALREAWAAWRGVPQLPARTSGYYRGLLTMLSDESSALEERRRLLEVIVQADLPADWRQSLVEHGEGSPNAA